MTVRELLDAIKTASLDAEVIVVLDDLTGDYSPVRDAEVVDGRKTGEDRVFLQLTQTEDW